MTDAIVDAPILRDAVSAESGANPTLVSISCTLEVRSRLVATCSFAVSATIRVTVAVSAHPVCGSSARL
ncbi:hypothetical protein GCM10027601_20840 [Nocardioides ungokensis]